MQIFVWSLELFSEIDSLSEKQLPYFANFSHVVKTIRKLVGIMLVMAPDDERAVHLKNSENNNSEVKEELVSAENQKI